MSFQVYIIGGDGTAKGVMQTYEQMLGPRPGTGYLGSALAELPKAFYLSKSYHHPDARETEVGLLTLSFACQVFLECSFVVYYEL